MQNLLHTHVLLDIQLLLFAVKFFRSLCQAKNETDKTETRMMTLVLVNLNIKFNHV